MAFQKGQSGNPAGKAPGTTNRLTKDVKEMILSALEKAGGSDYLLKQAEENPTAFLTLVGKVLPMQLTGMNGGPIEHTDPNRLPDAVAGVVDRLTGRAEATAEVPRPN